MAIALFLSFKAAWVRPKFQERPQAAYDREHHRITWLVRSAQRVGTRLPIYVVVGPERDAAKEAQLLRLGVRGVIPGKTVTPPPWASRHHRLAFSKIGALALTQFDKVFVLDNDMVLLGNIDHLAYAPTPAAVWHTALTPWQWRQNESCAVTTGLLGLTPSSSEFKRAKRHLAAMNRWAGNGSAVVYDGGDQAFFREFYVWYELPARYHVHQALKLPPDDWARVRLLHIISGFRDRSLVPQELRARIHYFY